MTSYQKIVTSFRTSDSERVVCKNYIFIDINLLSCKIENRTKKSLTQLTILLWVEVLFLPKSAIFLQEKKKKKKNADI